MKKKIRFAAMASMASILATPTAQALPGLANPGQQGSLLIFPRVVVNNGWSTIIRITNNYNNDIPGFPANLPVHVKCYWMEQGAVNQSTQFPTYPDFKEQRDFSFDLTHNATVWFNAKDGYGGDGFSVSAFPPASDGTYNPGELICWATNPQESRVWPWNYLSGTAELVKTSPSDDGVPVGDTNKYTAYALANQQAAPATGDLLLNGLLQNIGNAQYDSCPQYMVSAFSPARAQLSVDGAQVNYVSNILSYAGCTQNITYQGYPGKATWIPYQLTFEVWNSSEVKRSGAYEQGDSTWEVDLAQVDTNGTYFTYAGLGTDVGLFRAWDGNANTGGKGLLGVLQTTLNVGFAAGTDTPSDYNHTNVSNVSGAGQVIGNITYTPGSTFPQAVTE
jgi:hypothetical protein